MRFQDHSKLKGEHAYLSPSNYHWINYTPEKLKQSYLNHLATERGTKLHAFAEKCIELAIKLPENGNTLNQYVNDCIDFKMIPEVVLYYSPQCYGTTDAINFSNDCLHIFDLKTGKTKASMTQLKIYAAIFCLEYDIDPHLIDIYLRIYQSDAVTGCQPEAEEIIEIMSTIEYFDELIATTEVGPEWENT